MSVQKNTYMLIGAKWEFKEFYELPEIKKDVEKWAGWKREDDYHDSAFEGIHHHNGLCVISDGMNGKYVYVGCVIKKSDNYGDIDDYINDEEVTPEQVSQRIKDEFNIDVDCEMHVFTHYR